MRVVVRQPRIHGRRLHPADSTGSAVELHRHELEVALAAFAHDLRAHGAADQLADDHTLKLVHALDRRAVELDDEVLGTEPGAIGGPTLDHLHDLDARAA